MVRLGSLTGQAATFLDAAVRAGLNVLVSGQTQAAR
jgi:pilus assembly protein CpaF